MLEINSLIFSFSKVKSFSEIIFSKTSSLLSKLSLLEKSLILCVAVSFSSGWNLGKIKTLKKIKTIIFKKNMSMSVKKFNKIYKKKI